MRSASATASRDVVRDQHRGEALVRQSRSISACISMRVSASSAPSGSSRASRRGRLTSARASATRCFWPPESTDGPVAGAGGEADLAEHVRRPLAGRRAAAAGAAEPDLDIVERRAPRAAAAAPGT